LLATLAKTSITKRGYWSIELVVHTHNDSNYKQSPKQSGSKMTEAEIEQAMREMSEQK
jgi:hypothetical protein